MATEALFIDRSGLSAVKIHPVVVLSILEQYVRRDCDDGKADGHVIGTLLGTVIAGVVEVTNCFGVPFVQKGDTVGINMLSASKSLALHAQLNPSEVVVGWYSTCSEKTFVAETTGAIHEYYMKETARAVYLGIDVSFRTPHLPIKAFFAPTSVLMSKCRMLQFQELPCASTASAKERIGLSALSLAYESRPHSLPDDTQTLLDSIASLSDSIEAAIAFVDDVLKGSEAADPVVGRKIADALSSIPHVTSSTTTSSYLKSLGAAVQDALMIMHIAKVANARVAVTDGIRYASALSRADKE